MSSTTWAHHRVRRMTPRARDHGDDRERQRSSGRGGTQLYDAIFLASDELMKPKDGRKALVIFSDGVDRGSKESLNEALDAAEHANVSVYTIYFKGEQERGKSNGFPGGGRRGGGGWPGGGGGYPGRRRRLSRRWRRRAAARNPRSTARRSWRKSPRRPAGAYFEAKKRENLEEIYSQIAEELRGQYLLTYTPDMVDNDGGYHKVALKANNGDLSVQTREGYYAPGGDASNAR